jgi:hypothetical protein
MFKEIRSSCPDSNSVCSSVILRKTGKKSRKGQEDFELHLKWVPDGATRAFLKTFTLKHKLSMIEKGKSLTIYKPKKVS